MSILATDNFNRANENPLAGNWTTGPGEGNMRLVGNLAANFGDDGIDCAAYYSAITWPNDQYSKAKLATTGTAGSAAGPMLTVRQSNSADTHYRLAVDHAGTNNVDLRRRVAGTTTPIATFTQAWTDGDTWELRVQGTTLSVWLNGVQVGTNQTDANIASGYAGIAYSSLDANATIDDWEGGDFAGGGGGGPAIDSDYLFYQVVQR